MQFKKEKLPDYLVIAAIILFFICRWTMAYFGIL